MTKETSLPELTQRLSDEFDELCRKRHEQGQKEYGQFTYLEADLVSMIKEEVADAANYLRYLFIKIALMEAAILDYAGQVESGTDSAPGVQGLKVIK